MAETLSELVVEITTDAAGLRKGLDKATSGIQSWVKENERQFKAVGAALTGIGAVITGSLGMMTKAAIDEEVNIKRLGVALQGVGVNYDDVKESLEGVILATQRKTGIADDQQRDVLGRLILVTKDYDKALSLLPLALDLAAAGQMDASTAATYLAKGYEELEGGATEIGIRLGQATVKFKDLNEVQKLVGGTAEATANPFNILKASIGDLAEKIGSFLVPILKDIVDKVVPIIEKVQEWTNAHPELTKQLLILAAVIGSIALVLGPLLIMLPFLITSIGLLLGPIGLVVAAIMGLIAIGTLLILNWTTIKNKTIEIWGSITDFFEVWWNNLKSFLSRLNPWEWIKQGWENLRDGIKNVLKTIFGGSDVENWTSGLNKYLSSVDLKPAGETMMGTFRRGVASQLKGIADDVEINIEALRAGIKGTTGAGREAAILRYQWGKMGYTTEAAYLAGSGFGSFSKMQHGGIVTRPTLSLVGEAGPEAVIPLDKMGREVNIFVELDSKIIARAIGLPLVEEIRARTGLK